MVNSDWLAILFLAMNLLALFVGSRLERNRWESKADQNYRVATSKGLYLVKTDTRFKD